MKAADYAAIRDSLGTQEEVARLLGVHPQTISKRERGVAPVTREAELALLSLRSMTRTVWTQTVRTSGTYGVTVEELEAKEEASP